jgi:hypothetical protein
LTQAQQYFASLGFGVAFFVFLTLAFFFAKNLESGQYLILRIMTSIFGAVTAGLFTGAATLSFTEKFRGQELTVGGVAGFVVFLLVWLRFPKPDTGPTVKPDPANVNFRIPDGWVFKQALDSLARITNCVVDYGDLIQEELKAPLNGQEIHAKDPETAIKTLRSMTTNSGAIREFDVTKNDSTYYIKVR